MDYTYSYLIGCIFPLIIWAAIYLSRRDVRKEMLHMSIIAGIISPVMGAVYLIDWWNPSYAASIYFGLEDAIYGFLIAGISVSGYQAIFKKQFKENKRKDLKEMLLLLAIFLVGFIILSLAVGTILGSYFLLIGFMSYVYVRRKDLICYSLLSGLILMLISIPSYIIVEMVTPGWIQNIWYMGNLSGIMIWRIPIEELVWHFLIGASVSTFYKYKMDSKETKKDSSS